MKVVIIATAILLSLAAPALAQYDSVNNPAGSNSNSYVGEVSQPNPYGDNGYNVGSQGYNGTTGQVDTTYVPAPMSDPNPPPNVTGQPLGY